MDTNKMRDISREQFEEKFPVPAGIAWDESLGMYKVVDIWKLVSTLQIGDHNSRWEGWQASRDAVVVEIEQIRSEAKRQEDGLKEMLRRQNKQICALRGKQ